MRSSWIPEEVFFEKQQLRASLLNTTSLLSPDHSTGFTSNVVKQVVQN